MQELREIKRNKKIYKNLRNGGYLLLIKEYKYDINLYLECDKDGNAIFKKRAWTNTNKLCDQTKLIKGYKNLELCQQHQKQ